MYKYFFKKLPWVFVSLFLLNACGNVDNDDAGRANTLQSEAAVAPTTKSKADRIKALYTALQIPELQGKVKGLWENTEKSWANLDGPFHDMLLSSIEDLRVVMDKLAAKSNLLDKLAQKNFSDSNFDAKNEYNQLTDLIDLPLEEIANAAKQLKMMVSVRPSAGTLTEDEARGRKPYIFVNKGEVKQLTGQATLTNDQGNGTGKDVQGDVDPEVKGDEQITLAEADSLVKLAEALLAFAS